MLVVEAYRLDRYDNTITHPFPSEMFSEKYPDINSYKFIRYINITAMSKVIFVRGIQGSGKTTWAKQWVEEEPKKRVRISWDDLRNMFGKYWVPTREKLVSEGSYEIFKKALECGYDVVIDNMNLSEKSISIFKEIAESFSCQIEFKDFNTPLEVCIERDSKRENPIGETVIRRTYKKYYGTN